MNVVTTPLVLGGLGTTEILIILGILILLFGAKKLPELARGSGRALRIFKAETKGLIEDEDDDKHKTPEQRQIDAAQRTESSLPDSSLQQSRDTER
jgi:sec-independent protein translocase protein TatA